MIQMLCFHGNMQAHRRGLTEEAVPLPSLLIYGWKQNEWIIYSNKKQVFWTDMVNVRNVLTLEDLAWLVWISNNAASESPWRSKAFHIVQDAREAGNFSWRSDKWLAKALWSTPSSETAIQAPKSSVALAVLFEADLLSHQLWKFVSFQSQMSSQEKGKLITIILIIFHKNPSRSSFASFFVRLLYLHNLSLHSESKVTMRVSSFVFQTIVVAR